MGPESNSQLLLAHHLKALKLPTFLREYDKLARQCAAEGWPRVMARSISTPRTTTAGPGCTAAHAILASVSPSRLAKIYKAQAPRPSVLPGLD